MVNPQTDEIRPISVSESPEDKFREFLEIRGEKLTDPRRVLVRHIYSTHKHFDADELVRDLHDSGRAISRSTVYRTLRLLVDAGLLRELRLTNRTAYEHDYGYPDHDHLHCTSCNKVVEFRNEEILKLRDAVSRANGFRASGHRFLIEGVCSSCSRSHSPRRRLDLI
ncbi:Fur family transcriptional regulator [Paludisphaera borealis]|uniref:Ferric uptake regulation protein n=1 Tax=Paludisphaera borealis TaxID=1387353 RepID=A0A1U7CVC7_9BACT|nr:Fur family transcriptional regulator [Paludisphaera borealis]APW62910.1 Ferric uptake regulation protein [Paludisphaera borealis]MDR3618983.1 Fur family transcriptional regulator [Paludisphaera borealis]